MRIVALALLFATIGCVGAPEPARTFIGDGSPQMAIRYRMSPANADRLVLLTADPQDQVYLQALQDRVSALQRRDALRRELSQPVLARALSPGDLERVFTQLDAAGAGALAWQRAADGELPPGERVIAVRDARGWSKTRLSDCTSTVQAQVFATLERIIINIQAQG